MQFFEVVEFLAVQLNLPQLVPGPQGSCALRFDGVVVCLHHDPVAQSFEIRSDLGRLQPGDDARRAELLAANGEPQASILGCDAGGHASLRQRFALAELSLPRFFRSLERFVDRSEHWQLHLQAQAIGGLAAGGAAYA